MKTFITSDLHLNHKFVAFLRGFSTSEEHDSALEEAWRETIGERDTVWVLGDVHLGKMGDSLDTIARLPGHKRLVPGNHDQCHPMHAKHAAYARTSRVFESIQLAAAIRHEGQKVLLSHMPYSGDHTEVARFEQWRLPDLGAPILHGHTHSKEKFTASPKGTPQVHVGIDAWGLAPVQIEQALELIP